MAVGPAHGRLDDQMQPVEADVEWHLDAAQDHGLDVVEGDLEPGEKWRHSCRHLTTLHLGGPVPWQELVQPVDSVIVDATEHVGKPSLRINVVEPGRLNERQHQRGAHATTIRRGLIVPGFRRRKSRSPIRFIHWLGKPLFWPAGMSTAVSNMYACDKCCRRRRYFAFAKRISAAASVELSAILPAGGNGAANC
jgi:hypothetical protein